MKSLFIASFFASTLLIGCTTFQTVQSSDGKTTTTKTTVRTFFDAHNELSKFRTTQTDKSQGVSVASLNETTSGSNAVSLAESIVSAAVSAAIKSVKP